MRNWQTPSLVTGGRWWSPVSAVSELLLMSRFYQENIVIWDVGTFIEKEIVNQQGCQQCI